MSSDIKQRIEQMLSTVTVDGVAVQGEVRFNPDTGSGDILPFTAGQIKRNRHYSDGTWSPRYWDATWRRHAQDLSNGTYVIRQIKSAGPNRVIVWFCLGCDLDRLETHLQRLH